jgi:hypothetical protein
VHESGLALSDAQLRVMVVPLLAMLELRHRELRRVAASCDAWRECCSALSSGGASGGAEGLTTSGSAPAPARFARNARGLSFYRATFVHAVL